VTSDEDGDERPADDGLRPDDDVAEHRDAIEDGLLDNADTERDAARAWDGFVGRLEAREQLRIASAEASADARSDLPGSALAPPDEGLIGRLKAAWTTRPLHALEQHKGQRGWEAFAIFELALLAIDTVVERMELGTGATPEEVRDLLAEAAAMRVPEATRELRTEVADGILDVLLQEFATDYGVDDGDGGYTVKRWRPKLLLEIEGENGIQLRATPIAVNVLVSALDVDDIESSQAATHAALESLIKRGRLDLARRRAEDARKLSKTYAEEIRRLVAASRRSVRSVSWDDELRPGLTKAYAHLAERTEAESAMAHRLEEQQEDPATRVKGTKAADVAGVLDLVRDCLSRHRDLHTAVMRAQQELLAHQAEQAFRPPPPVALIDLDRVVLPGLLDIPAGRATMIVEETWSSFAGPVARAVPGLDVMVRRLLQPMQTREPTTGEEVGGDDEEFVAELEARFGRERIERVNEAITDRAASNGRTLLSGVLRVLDDDEDRRLAGLLALAAFDPVAGEDRVVSALAGSPLHKGVVEGDDLVLVPISVGGPR
jgi:hypothetical protein